MPSLRGTTTKDSKGIYYRRFQVKADCEQECVEQRGSAHDVMGVSEQTHFVYSIFACLLPWTTGLHSGLHLLMIRARTRLVDRLALVQANRLLNSPLTRVLSGLLNGRPAPE